jgi:hypothetical protein
MLTLVVNKKKVRVGLRRPGVELTAWTVCGRCTKALILNKSCLKGERHSGVGTLRKQRNRQCQTSAVMMQCCGPNANR